MRDVVGCGDNEVLEPSDSGHSHIHTTCLNASVCVRECECVQVCAGVRMCVCVCARVYVLKFVRLLLVLYDFGFCRILEGQ